ncbi:hypothetical protein THAOC_23317, partial [Thalassiosira oceanica]
EAAAPDGTLVAAEGPYPVPRAGVPEHGRLVVARGDEEVARGRVRRAPLGGLVDRVELHLGHGAGVTRAHYGDLPREGRGRHCAPL